jgi:phage/plasmid-associated DNA primase
MDRLADLAGYRDTLLGTLIHGCFCDDAPEDRREKILVLQEVAGSIAGGYATQLREPKAVIGVGPRGGNGKSQWGDVFMHMADEEATRSISPSKFGDDYHVVDLVGAVANIVNELPVRAVSGDAFKQVISGEPVRGRQIYKAPSQFRPVAQHWYTCNEVPIFMGGIDGGVYRRLLFVPFDRVIPDEERIPHLGERIAQEEPELLLAFAAQGLQRLIRNRNFTVPASSSKTLEEAAAEADPVRAWARAWLCEVKPGMGPGLLAAEAYEHFRIWYSRQGYKSEYRPSHIAFGKRVRNVFPNRQDRHLRTGTLWASLAIRTEDADGAEAA